MFGWLRRTEAALAGAPAPSAAPPGGDLQALLHQLEWTVLRRLDGALQGQYRSLFRGAGLDLADLREYQVNDDVRHIDWNATARLQVPHVRLHQQDREVSAWFLLDMTGSMMFGSGATSKRQRMLEFVGLMGLLLQRHGNRVGAVILHPDTDVHMQVMPARMGRRHLLHLMDAVQKFAPSQKPHASPLGPWLRQVQSLIRRRSQVFVLSDFLGESDWTEALVGLARRHDGVAVRLSDPLEQVLPAAGLVWLQDAESAEQMLLDTSDPGLRRRFAELSEQREANFVQALALAGMDGLSLSTDDDLVLALRHYVALRQRRRLHA